MGCFEIFRNLVSLSQNCDWYCGVKYLGTQTAHGMKELESIWRKEVQMMKSG
jgi:hypothetical protein